MNRHLKSLILSVAVGATTFAAFPAAAGDRWRERDHRPVASHNRTGEIVAAGVVGLAVGALIAGASSRSQPVYRVDDEPYRYQRPRAQYYPSYDERPAHRVRYVDEGYGAEPWTAAWYDWCEQRYRSFNPQTGTYRAYDGRERFCVAP